MADFWIQYLVGLCEALVAVLKIIIWMQYLIFYAQPIAITKAKNQILLKIVLISWSWIIKTNNMHQNLPASYEAALDELQKILENIENQAVSLDVITDKAQRARFLIEHCRNKLRKIEEDTEQLLQV